MVYMLVILVVLFIVVKIKKMLLLIDIQYSIIKKLMKRLDKIESRNYINDSL
jgi:hypothetical protein